MDTVTFLIGLLQYTLSGYFIVIGAYFLFRNQIDQYYNLKALEYRRSLIKETVPLKLQAYERLTVFIERINPSNLFIRLHTAGMSAQEMQVRILTEIRAEYQHNVSQQLYVSADSWNIVKRVKDDTLALVNAALSQIGEQATAVALSKAVFARVAELEQDPYDLALMVLKRDMEEIL